jgi:hypothetical protein
MDIRIDCAICCTDTTIDGLDDGLQLEHAAMVINSYHQHDPADVERYRDSESRYITGVAPDVEDSDTSE